MKLTLQIIAFILYGGQSYAQFSQVDIETDSSTIEVTKNSVYRIWEETYKNKDSVFYSVSFINDTTQINTEGWKNKKGEYLGVWQEYNSRGELMYERNHDNATCEINRSLYPYHDLLVSMKEKADKLIRSNYSNEFFNNNVRFNFNSYAYDENGYVGTWIEPMIRKPTKFLFRYQVRLSNSEWQDDMIGIELDEFGEYIPNACTFNNCGFERIEGASGVFMIDKQKAVELCKSRGLTNTDQIDEFLIWEKFKKAELYNGQFRYYITELYEEVKYEEGVERKGIVFKFNVYVFNPWTNEFIEKKKMKSIKEWGEDSGHSTGLIPDNE